MVTVYII